MPYLCPTRVPFVLLVRFILSLIPRQSPQEPPQDRGLNRRRSAALGLVVATLFLQSCAGTGLGAAVERALSSGNSTGTPAPSPGQDPPSPEIPNPEPSPNPDVSTPGVSTPGVSTPVEDPLSSPETNATADSPGGVVSRDLSANEVVLSLDPAQSSALVDLTTAPLALQPAIRDVIALGSLVLTSSPAPNTLPFPFDQALTRREFVRWLVTTNNIVYANRPAQQIRLAVATETPVFQDVPSQDPDFGAIQGLANAGIIASTLRGDLTAVQFQPNLPLTREALLQWKVPLDLRQGLPTATIEAIQQTWGFQDTARISAPALGVVLADFQNGDLSNIRRVFGYTKLFQPQKTVTRAEAAAALWYFGFQGQGVSAAEGQPLAEPTSPSPTPQVSPSPN